MFLYYIESKSGIRGSLTDTTSVVKGELEVTLITPLGTPRVLDDERRGSVTDSQDSVVKLNLLTTFGDDTGVILLNGSSINSNGDGLLSNSLL